LLLPAHTADVPGLRKPCTKPNSAIKRAPSTSYPARKWHHPDKSVMWATTKIRDPGSGIRGPECDGFRLGSDPT